MLDKEKCQELKQLGKECVPNQSVGGLRDAARKLEKIAAEYGVEIAMFGEQSSLRTITVIHWSVELWGYVIDFPSGLDVSGQIGIITVATLLLVFSKISPHFKFTQINECSSLKAFFVKYKTSETVWIEEILKAWGIRLE